MFELIPNSQLVATRSPAASAAFTAFTRRSLNLATKLSLAAGLGCGAVNAQAASEQVLAILALSCTSGVASCNLAGDGNFPPEGQQWQTGTAWWTGTGKSITYQLDDNYHLSNFVLSADNNDSYRLEVSDDGLAWAAWGTVSSSVGEIGYGLETVATSASHAEYVAGLAFSAVDAGWVRVTAISGDNNYSVGELRLLGTPVSTVPEPATWALCLAGLSLAGNRRARPRRY